MQFFIIVVITFVAAVVFKQAIGQTVGIFVFVYAFAALSVIGANKFGTRAGIEVYAVHVMFSLLNLLKNR